MFSFILLAISFHLIKNSIRSIFETLLIFLSVDFLISIVLTCFVFDKITFQKFMSHLWLIVFTSLFYGASNLVILITLQKHQSYKNHIHHQGIRQTIRITSLLALKSFEVLIVSLEQIDEYSTLDVYAILLYLIILMMMTCDDTSSLLVI